MIETPPLPDVDDEEAAPFWEGCRHRQLLMQTCSGCGRMRFPPRVMCPWCRSVEASWEPVSGCGTIWSFIVPHPPMLPALAALAPYNVVLVALDEDSTLRLVGNLVASPDGAINEIDPATIEIGAPVEVVFQPVADDVTLPRWMLSP